MLVSTLDWLALTKSHHSFDQAKSWHNLHQTSLQIWQHHWWTRILDQSCSLAFDIVSCDFCLLCPETYVLPANYWASITQGYTNRHTNRCFGVFLLASDQSPKNPARPAVDVDSCKCLAIVCCYIFIRWFWLLWRQRVGWGWHGHKWDCRSQSSVPLHGCLWCSSWV